MIISHPAYKEYQRKPLTEHLENVANGCFSRIQRLSLNTKTLSKANLEELSYRIGLFHDIGKASSYFQKHIRGESVGAYSRHSLISAIILYYDLCRISQYKSFAPLAFKAVQRHHGELSSFGTENLDDGVLVDTTLVIYEDIKRQINTDLQLKDFYSRHDIQIPELSKRQVVELGYDLEDLEQVSVADDAIERFFIQNLLFSVLIDSDKYDAARLDIQPDQFLETGILYSPAKQIERKGISTNELNAIRGRLTESAANTVLKEQRCYAMSAPTGSGKTFACMAFADSIQRQSNKPRRVIYCLPYTSIIDQNHSEIANVLKANGLDSKNPDLLLKHHHLVDFSRSARSESYDLHDYLVDNLLADSWNSACVVSTFVQFFHSLIGYRNSLVRKLHNIINSIILLDEVQNLPPKYYPLLRTVFRVLATRFDTVVLSCTATQPYIFEPNTYSEISPPRLFDHPVFNRVKLYVHNQPCSIVDFVEKIDLGGDPNALFVMNTKRSAIDLYHKLKAIYKDDYEVYCLTTYHTPNCRINRIEDTVNALKQGKPIIMISTQLIEAGVDISFKRVFRDFGPLDSIIQVAGRCNRHGEYGELGGRFDLFNLHNDGTEFSKQVYDSYLIQKTKDAIGTSTSIESREFADLIRRYYLSLEFSAESKALMYAIKELNYDQDYRDQLAIQSFKLIEDQYANQSLYILLDQEAQQAMDDLLECKRKLCAREFQDQDEESILRLQIRRSYHTLSRYQLSLTRGDIRHYDNSMSYFNKLDDSVFFIPFDYVEQAYSQDTGFLPDPYSAGSIISL